jgi:hypothetical protein
MIRPSNRGINRVQWCPWLLLWAGALRSLHTVRPSDRALPEFSTALSWGGQAPYSGNDPICRPYLPLKTALNHLLIMFSGLVAKLIVVCRRQFQMFALKTKSSITLHPFTFLWSFRLTPLKCKVNWYPWDHLLQRGSWRCLC